MPNKINPLSPVLPSPCLMCQMRNKPKNTYTCEVCKARADFAMASNGDKKALQRYIAFKYPDLGVHREPPVIIPQPVKKRLPKNDIWYGRRPATEEHYEQYFDTLGMEVNKKYGKDFKTMKEVVAWLYETFKSQKYIAENELYISAFTVHCMLKCYDIRRLSKKEITDLFIRKKGT